MKESHFTGKTDSESPVCFLVLALQRNLLNFGEKRAGQVVKMEKNKRPFNSPVYHFTPSGSF